MGSILVVFQNIKCKRINVDDSVQVFVFYLDVFFLSLQEKVLSDVFFRLLIKDVKIPKGITIKKVLAASLERVAVPNVEDRSTSDTADDDDSDQKCEKDANPSKKRQRPSGYIKIRNTRYMCTMCSKMFPTFEELNEHVTAPVPCTVLVVSCPICDKEFSKKSNCVAHMETHKERTR